MGKKERKETMSCACGFLTCKNAMVGTECPLCHTKNKIRPTKSRVFTKENRNDLCKFIAEHDGKLGARNYMPPVRAMGPVDEGDKKNLPVVSLDKQDVIAQYAEFEKRVCEIGRVEFSDGYFGTDLYGSRRERMDAYVKAMKRKHRLLLFEYEPTYYKEGAERYKVENPYKPNARSVSFDISLTNWALLNAAEEDWESLGGTRAMAKAYVQNRANLVIPSDTDPTIKTNTQLCKADYRGSIYDADWIQRIEEDGPEGIKYLLNGGELCWCRFGELAVFSKYLPFDKIEAIMPVHGTMVVPGVGPETDVVRVRFDNGFARIMYDDPAVSNPSYMMSFYDMYAWASQICYVRTPIARAHEIRPLNDEGFASHAIEGDSKSCAEADEERNRNKESSDSETYIYAESLDASNSPDVDEDADAIIEKKNRIYHYSDGVFDYGYLMFDWTDNVYTWAYYDKHFELVDAGAAFGNIDLDWLIDRVKNQIFTGVNFVDAKFIKSESVDFNWLMEEVETDIPAIYKMTSVAYMMHDESILRVRRDSKSHFEWELFDADFELVRTGYVKNYKTIAKASKCIVELIGKTVVHICEPVSLEFFDLCNDIETANND